MVEQGISRTAGKWRRAISSIEDMPVAQESAGVEVIEIISSAVNVLSTAQNDDIINLYSVGHEEVTRTMCNMGVEAPFSIPYSYQDHKGKLSGCQHYLMGVQWCQ